MIHCSVRILLSWCVGLLVWTGGLGASVAQEPPTSEALIQAAPKELRAWLAHTTPSRTLPFGSYPIDQLFDVLPPYAPQLFTAEVANGTIPALEVVASRVFEVPVADRAHQLAANGDLDDTTRCG